MLGARLVFSLCDTQSQTERLSLFLCRSKSLERRKRQTSGFQLWFLSTPTRLFVSLLALVSLPVAPIHSVSTIDCLTPEGHCSCPRWLTLYKPHFRSKNCSLIKLHVSFIPEPVGCLVDNYNCWQVECGAYFWKTAFLKLREQAGHIPKNNCTSLFTVLYALPTLSWSRLFHVQQFYFLVWLYLRFSKWAFHNHYCLHVLSEKCCHAF